MSTQPLRVGIIGADTRASWAGASHVPAIRTQPGLALAAVATRSAQSASAAAEAFGASRWYADPYRLIEDDGIDIVTVAVKVPAHRELVLAALRAGKAVYSESPLGATLEQTAEMASAARGLHTAIGLQGRMNPSVRRAAELVASGRLGRVMSANVRATTFGYGPTSPAAYDYFNKAASGASFLTITTAHVLDVVEAVLGDITELDARTERLWPEVALVDTGGTSVREIADHVDLVARTALGASMSVQVLAGVESDPHFVMEVRGSKGVLKLTGSHLAGVQVGDLSLSAGVDFAAPDAPVASGVGPTAAAFWNGAAINVGEVYASLARDLRAGSFDTPGFAHALHNHRLVAAVERAADSGQRQRDFGAPGSERAHLPTGAPTITISGERHATGKRGHSTGAAGASEARGAESRP
ncbi:Gfo/Idh/MocA family protein [Luteimonas kalidii]|uniref:Gfo/Idh/MocA family oxidoreductase n=1 Tax=Luteimonas kalidii TaxID=3042025 RepID=A0ABT6JQ51_9GAMM|nr:Gfo/Idh/MocA family oxidoreductase [Luteimonas kalidii]MDH5832807.1 Gfo/Idh/MocA family oxidoreductase [Luteimonas kalidii]